MDDAQTLAPTSSVALVKGRLGQAVLLAYQIVALLVFITAPILAFSWLNQPFLGAFFDNNLVTVNLAPTVPNTWEAFNQGLVSGDRLIQVAGNEIQNTKDLNDTLGAFAIGDSVSILAVTSNGEPKELEVRLQRFSTFDRIAHLYTPFLLGIIYIASSLWFFRLRQEDSSGKLVVIFSTSIAIFLGTFFDFLTTQNLTFLWTYSAAFISGSLIHLTFTFPRDGKAISRWPILGWVGYSFALFFVTIRWTYILMVSPSNTSTSFGAPEFIIIIISFGIFLIGTLLRRFWAASPIEKEQSRPILWGSLAAFGPLFFWWIGQSLGLIKLGTPSFWFYLSISFIPLTILYIVLRFRLINTDYILSKTAMYTLLTVFSGAGYALFVSGLSLIFGDLTSTNNPFIIGTVVLLLALILNPLRQRLQRGVDTLFFRGQEKYTEQAESFKQELSKAVELREIEQILWNYIHNLFYPIRMHLFVNDPLTNLFIASPDNQGKKTTDIRFTANSELVQLLSRDKTPLFLDPSQAFPSALQQDKARIALLGAQLFIALPSQDQISGWVAIGPRKSGESYSMMDINVLTAFCKEAAIAVERAQILADKDRRVHQMNVLTRVAQGVNITLEFDDILELIYAQTFQVLPISDFSITLYNSGNKTLRHVFYIENDERLKNFENKFLSPTQGLEPAVIKTQRAILTEDYERECSNLGVLPARTGVIAWLSIPLNAGADTIGVVSIGSRDPSLVYTQEQSNILQAIADQASGAIVKAQLLEESERRAQQLATLNDVARSLTSTLEIDPLLNGILQSAVTILNCEAGSLLLIDNDTGELVFEVATGPVAEDLIGKRLQANVGLVGKAVQGRRPQTVNNVENSDEWFDQPDKQTGFATRGLMAVPMMIKERVIGVIEVINKRDLMPFNTDDKEMLMAFTGQAAIAVENARLYTLTDQKLTSRVEELSVLQRIDRELNATLDVERAMTITLEWAMRQANTTAGLIGVVEEQGLQIMAFEGYDQELEPYQEDRLPLELPAINEAITTGQIQQLQIKDFQDGASLLNSAVSQLVIPIRRENEVIGVLLLENTEAGDYSKDTEDFLLRLGDHAAIAISNAQLYAAVHEANIAKSDFVSFVSHELKTPMTSIKGYADLLVAGSVGEINEGQSNFLNTIRNNVSRMSTLVSDLADVSRIEAGRLHLEFSQVNVPEIIDEIIDSARAMIDEKKQKLNVIISDDIPTAWGDRNRLIQILTNLLSNANKYTLEGETITIRAQESENEWDEQGAPNVLLISVWDNGIGIKEEDQKKIFQQYFRTDEGKGTAPGTGLGLNITKYLVEMQGGKIWFETEFGKGTTFYFTVPVVELQST